MKYIDITEEISIRAHHGSKRTPAGKVLCNNKDFYRLTISYKGKCIGVLKSSGFDLLENYRVMYHKHPKYNDNSWLTFERLDTPEEE